MKLTKLQLENFRNYQNYLYKFPENTRHTIIIGGNGKGKTNLLESIYMLSLGKSFRSSSQEDMIRWGDSHMRCKGKINKNGDTMDLEVFYSIDPLKKKNFKKNEVNVKNSEYLGDFLTVLFHPEDLNMLYLSPSLRRRYLDITLCQTDKKYLNALQEYKKVMKQRNALLGEIRENMYKGRDVTGFLENLNVWDEKFLTFAEEISEKRKNFKEFIEGKIEDFYREISGGEEKVKIEYKCSLKSPEKLLDARKYDINRAESSCGPHRDDLKFYIDEKEINSTASRGEFRTLLLAIKLGEIDYIKEKSGYNPLLLLDDVFSELDEKRQKHLLQAIKECQSIITTTDMRGLEELSEESNLIRVD
jgi:DNA replication and repair protein RecF